MNPENVSQQLIKAYVKPNIKAAVKTYCTEKGISVSELTGDLLTGFIQQQPEAKKVVPAKQKSHNHY